MIAGSTAPPTSPLRVLLTRGTSAARHPPRQSSQTLKADVGTKSMKACTHNRLAKIFLAASTSLPIFIVYIFSISVLASINPDQYLNLHATLNSLAGILLYLLIGAQWLCIICAITAFVGTKSNNIKYKYWKAGGIIFVGSWIFTIIMTLIFPHPPLD